MRFLYRHHFVVDFGKLKDLKDWLERMFDHTMLINEDERVRYRMALPTSLPEGTITQEIPFGAIERPAGEFPAQNWMDYSDTDHGIALLNRRPPGNCVDHGVVLLSLLKAKALKEGYGESGGYNKNTKTTDGMSWALPMNSTTPWCRTRETGGMPGSAAVGWSSTGP